MPVEGTMTGDSGQESCKLSEVLEVSQPGLLLSNLAGPVMSQERDCKAVQPPAGPSYLCNLSEELLYCVNQHLAPRDQQNVFLTCRQLYSAWNIQL